jgi:hypothetical protein
MAADWTKFDNLFTCPASVTDDDLKISYEELYATAKRECEGLDLSSAQIMRTSVMLGWYFKHQQTSRVAYGDKGGYQHPGQEKDALLAWESIARSWDEVRRKAQPVAGGGLTPEVVRDIFVHVLGQVEDAGLRARLQDSFVEALSGA